MRATIAAVALATMLTGCATALHGSQQNIALAATTPGATVRVLPEHPEPVPLPTTVRLKRKYDHSAVFEKPGYQSQTVAIESKFSAVALGNVLFAQFGLITLPVDFILGGAYRLSPESTTVTLTPLQVEFDDEARRREAVPEE